MNNTQLIHEHILPDESRCVIRLGRDFEPRTGRATFSPGITHVVQLKQWARATIAGEPVGDELDTWAEGGNLTLPNSKLTVHYANAFHSYSKREYPDRRPYLVDFDVDSVAPDVVIEPTWTEYIQGRDPVLDAVEKRIRSARH